MSPNSSNNIWLISFGDLLTLVLCFFISIISLSPLNPDRKLPVQTGTELAHKEVNIQGQMPKQHLYSLNILENELTSSEQKISEAGLERIKKQVAPAGYNAKSFTVETCFLPGESNYSAQWEKSTGLLASIRSQVFDALPKLSAEKALLRNLAVDCEVNTAARIILEF